MAQAQRFTPGNNRSVLTTSEGRAYILHSTAVVTELNDGRLRFNSGGWRTVTTRRAINQVINQFYGAFAGVSQRKDEWFISFRDDRQDVSFYDGIVVIK